MFRRSSPSSFSSVPDHLPNSTVSPTFRSIGISLPASSRPPGPTATISPWLGFSLAVSGMMMPPADFSSASSTRPSTGVTAKSISSEAASIFVSTFQLKKLTLAFRDQLQATGADFHKHGLPASMRRSIGGMARSISLRVTNTSATTSSPTENFTTAVCVQSPATGLCSLIRPEPISMRRSLAYL